MLSNPPALRPFARAPVPWIKPSHVRALARPSRVNSYRSEFRENFAEQLKAVEDDSATFSYYQLKLRELEIAKQEEDYALCAQIRDTIDSTQKRLTRNKRLLIALLDQLTQCNKSKDPDTLISVIHSLRQLGEVAALPSLKQYLSQDRVGEAAEFCMWELFTRAPNFRAEALLSAGMQAMSGPEDWDKAINAFTELIYIEPQFAEGYNKRATTYYLQGKYDEAIADCKVTLSLNEFHFGAASGMGMSYAGKGDYEGAIKAFSLAMSINPRLSHLSFHIEQLKNRLEQQQ